MAVLELGSTGVWGWRSRVLGAVEEKRQQREKEEEEGWRERVNQEFQRCNGSQFLLLPPSPVSLPPGVCLGAACQEPM